MSKIIKYLGFLLAGTVLGFSSFWMLHKIQSDLFHDESVAELPWRLKNLQTELPEGEKGELVRLGYEIITNTSGHIGPLAKNPERRFAGNNLDCSNCHLDAGRKIGSGSFIGVSNRFPQFRGRENKMGSLEERIVGCMERSMNGRPLPIDSNEMIAMIAYMDWLGEDVPPDIDKLYKGYMKIEIPDYKADPEKGKLLYDVKCQLCHGSEGEGIANPGETFSGYLYPPIAGEDSYNDGAGMNRVITAANFIKGNMPFGATNDAPLVSDEEAYHLGIYINTLGRPSKANKEVDFPDKLLKPASTPYGPWEDEFSADQHKFGPFGPIFDFYRDEHGIAKSK